MNNQELLDAAFEAVEYVGQANWSGREEAAKEWLQQVFSGDTSTSLDQIQNRINQE